jgi:hypothetical protein
MAFLLSARARRAVPFAVAALVVCALTVLRLPAFAAPPIPAEKALLSATLESSSTAVPRAGTFGYTAHVRLSEPASYLQTRLQVRYPTGKLVYQRTMVENSVGAGVLSYSFGRTLEGLNLKPGVYPVRLSVSADTGGSTEETEVASDLLVYDAKTAAVPVVLVARVHGSPLSDPLGRLVIDPASPEAEIPRADVARIAALISEDPGARVVLAVPPVLLAEWRRLGAGYVLPNGTPVPPDSPVARLYADTLLALSAAVDSGRLELTGLGYADPDLSALVRESLVGDIGPQYAAGISALFASLEATPSAGTVPAGDCAPQKSLSPLAEKGVGYVVVSESHVEWGKAKAASGAYPITKERLSALVTDDKGSRALNQGNADLALRRTFARLSDGKPAQPYVVRIDLGPGHLDATSTVVAAATACGTEPWVRLTLGREIKPTAKTIPITLAQAPKEPSTPEDYWARVRSARTYADGLLAALGPGGSGVSSAQTDSLLAESASWAEPDGTWASAARGLGFADASLGISKAAFGKVTVKAEPVTFAGKRGEVPVSINNTTKNTLAVVVRASASGDARVVGTRRIKTVLRPQETFVPIPVDMQSALSSKLTIEVLAGDVVLAKETVDLQASYLDRIAIIGGIVLLLGGLLIFIVRRVRSVEVAEDDDVRGPRGTPSRSERYTTDERETRGGVDDT